MYSTAKMISGKPKGQHGSYTRGMKRTSCNHDKESCTYLYSIALPSSRSTAAAAEEFRREPSCCAYLCVTTCFVFLTPNRFPEPLPLLYLPLCTVASQGPCSATAASSKGPRRSTYPFRNLGHTWVLCMMGTPMCMMGNPMVWVYEIWLLGPVAVISGAASCRAHRPFPLQGRSTPGRKKTSWVCLI